MIDEDAIRTYAQTPDSEGKLPTIVDVSAKFHVSKLTVNRIMLSAEGDARTTVTTKATGRANDILKYVADYMLEHGWAPAQRDIADATGVSLPQVNYLLQVLKHEGLIEIGANPREIRIVGSKMVIPTITM